MTNRLALLIRQKLNRVSSVHFSYVALYAPLHSKINKTGNPVTVSDIIRHKLIVGGR